MGSKESRLHERTDVKPPKLALPGRERELRAPESLLQKLYLSRRIVEVM